MKLMSGKIMILDMSVESKRVKIYIEKDGKVEWEISK